MISYLITIKKLYNKSDIPVSVDVTHFNGSFRMQRNGAWSHPHIICNIHKRGNALKYSCTDLESLVLRLVIINAIHLQNYKLLVCIGQLFYKKILCKAVQWGSSIFWFVTLASTLKIFITYTKFIQYIHKWSAKVNIYGTNNWDVKLETALQINLRK